MKKSKIHQDDDGMREEYDFSNAIIGKYAKEYAKGVTVVLIDSDEAEASSTSKHVNKAKNRRKSREFESNLERSSI